tara:strand:+ start:537 stop:1151 length:615 start_codon:yes stop_codon:yes gene_type:complete
MKKTFGLLKILTLSIVLKFIYGTNKQKVKGKNNYLRLIKKNKSVIFSVWHGHLLSIVHDLRHMKISALAGTHKDADLISQIATNWGWNMIRGSSKKKGAEAYKSMLRLLNSPTNSLLFITPDGPSGPPRIPKKGIIRLAQKSRTAIIPIRVKYSKSWGFKNWDTFFLAKPFGKISINYGKPIYFEENQNQKTCQDLLIKAMESQ